MVYRNTITGLEVITDCVIHAPNFERVDNSVDTDIDGAMVQDAVASPIEEKPKKRTRRAKK